MGLTWQLNIINVHVSFGDDTDTFLVHVMETYPQLAVLEPTVIIGDFIAAPKVDDRRKRPTPEDTAVKKAMQHLDWQDLRASLQGQASHQPLQPGSTETPIDLCYTDPAHIELTQIPKNDMPSNTT